MLKSRTFLLIIFFANSTFGQVPIRSIDSLISDRFYTTYESDWEPFSRDYTFNYRGDSALINFILSDTVYRNLNNAISNKEKCTRLELINQRSNNHYRGLGQLEKLIYLNLNFAQDKEFGIQEFPVGLYELQNLKLLHASNADIKYISYQIENLKELEYLNLSKNDIVAVPPEIGKLNQLKFLDLSNNRLRVIPDEFSNLRELKYLNLSGNPLQYSIADEVSSMDSLEFLSLSIYQNFYALKDIITELEGLKNLKILHLRYSDINKLPEELKNLDQVEQLSLRGNYNLDLEQAFDVISGMESLKILDLSFNRIKSIPKNVDKLKQLQTIYLGNYESCCPLINFGVQTPYNDIQKLPSTISKLTSLQNLYLWTWGTSERDKMIMQKLLPKTNIEFDSKSPTIEWKD